MLTVFRVRLLSLCLFFLSLSSTSTLTLNSCQLNSQIVMFKKIAIKQLRLISTQKMLLLFFSDFLV